MTAVTTTTTTTATLRPPRSQSYLGDVKPRRAVVKLIVQLLPAVVHEERGLAPDGQHVVLAVPPVLAGGGEVTGVAALL